MPHKIPPPKGLALIVAVTSMIGPFTIDTYLPSFPEIEAEFGVSRALLSQSLAFYLAASVGCAMAADYGSFLFYRLLQGVAAGGGLVADSGGGGGISSLMRHENV